MMRVGIELTGQLKKNDNIMKQTHDKTSSLRDVASLLVLTMWALYDLVAPVHDYDGDDDDDENNLKVDYH